MPLDLLLELVAGLVDALIHIGGDFLGADHNAAHCEGDFSDVAGALLLTEAYLHIRLRPEIPRHFIEFLFNASFHRIGNLHSLGIDSYTHVLTLLIINFSLIDLSVEPIIILRQRGHFHNSALPRNMCHRNHILFPGSGIYW